MAAIDLITLADLKAYMNVQNTARDAVLRQFITTSSRRIEKVTGRRLRYRAPVATGEALILAAQAWADAGPIAAAAQPTAPGRTLRVTFTTATAGTLTVSGTVSGVAKTVTFDAADGLIQHGVDFFSAIASFAIAGAVGGGTVSVAPSAGYLEQHTVSGFDLYPIEWPLVEVLQVHEDASRVYSASALLAALTQFLAVLDGPGGGRLVRLSSSLRTAWLCGWRAVQVRYSAGYAGPAGVPEDIRDICRRLTAALFREEDRRAQGKASESDDLGSRTYETPADVTRAMSSQLAPYRRQRPGGETGERDFDPEAA